MLSDASSSSLNQHIFWHTKNLHWMSEQRLFSPQLTFFLAARPRLLVNLLLLSMEVALRRGDLPLFPPSGFSIHHELFPVPSFWTRTKRLCKDRLCLIEFCQGERDNNIGTWKSEYRCLTEKHHNKWKWPATIQSMSLNLALCYKTQWNALYICVNWAKPVTFSR